MERTTQALMTHLKSQGTAQSKLDLLAKIIKVLPNVTAAQLRNVMDLAEINPATKELANQWLAGQSGKTAPAPAAVETEPKPAAETEPKPATPKPRAKPATADAAGSD